MITERGDGHTRAHTQTHTHADTQTHTKSESRDLIPWNNHE